MNRSHPFVLFLLVFVVSMCAPKPPYYEVPRDRAAKLLLEPIPWSTADSLTPALSRERVKRGASRQLLAWDGSRFSSRNWAEGLAERREGGWSPIVEFLQVSDAQIRDERAYPPRALRGWDKVPYLQSTIRFPLMEILDGVVLDTFLENYRKQIEQYDVNESKFDFFVVHTGDLLDISLVTELIEAHNILRPIGEDLPVYSLVGNHDGLIFGNLTDEQTKTWEIGINRKEFVLGSLLLAPSGSKTDGGFGFACNEVISSPTAMHGLPETAEALERVKTIRALDKNVLAEVQMNPLAVKRTISVKKEEDELPKEENELYQLGYYDFEKGGIRFICLDTAWRNMQHGGMGKMQLGWLYLTLARALEKGEPVLVFAHHSPAQFRAHHDDADILRKMLRQFPNVLAYMYGHGHTIDIEGSGKPLLIQVPSTVDYPQAGALVRIFKGKGGEKARAYQLSLSFVRPAADATTSEGVILGGALFESWVMAYYDQYEVNRKKYGEFEAIKIPGNRSLTSCGFAKTRGDLCFHIETGDPDANVLFLHGRESTPTLPRCSPSHSRF